MSANHSLIRPPSPVFGAGTFSLFINMPVTNESTPGSEVALNMSSFNLDTTLGQIEKRLDPNFLAKVKTGLQER